MLGAADFTLDVRVPPAPQAVSVRAVDLGGVVFEQIPQLSRLVPGKAWFSLDLSSLTKTAGATGTLGSGGNPAAMLRLLSQQGNKVVAAGTREIDGVNVKSYTVTLDPSVISSQVASAKLPSWLRQAVSHVSFQSGTEMVFVDRTGRLKSIAIHLVIAAPSTPSGTVTLDETLDLSDYGVPVSISAPPAGQVVDLQQFLKDAAAAGSSNG